MDAMPTDRDDLNYSDKPPVLVAASSDAAMLRALGTVEASGLARRPTGCRSARPSERIERQVAATAIWLELDEDCGGPMDELLDLVSRDVADGRYAAVVSTSGALLDPVVGAVWRARRSS